jgi:type II secretory pathway component GspD/PulD (secretin)
MKSKMLIAIMLGCLVWQQGVLSQTDTTATDTNQSMGTTAINSPVAAAATTNESPSVTASGETPANPPAAPAVTTNESTASAATSTETPAASPANPPAAPAVTTNEPAANAATSTETPAASPANPPVAPVVTTNEPAASAATSTETPAASPANPPVAPVVTTNESPSATTSNETAVASAANPSVVAAVSTNASPVAASSSTPQAAVPASIPLIQFQDVPITTAIENLARQAGINYLLDPKIGYGQPDANGQVKPEPTLSIRWENITAAQALVALLDNYGLQLVENRQTHIARITTKDPSAPPPLSTRVVQIKYASTSNLLESIQASFTDKRSKVLSDVRTSQLVVVATEAEQEALDALVNQLDKPTREVLIETKLVEISSNPTTTKGVDWSGTLAAQHVTFGNGGMSGNTVANIPGIPVTTTTPGTTTPGSITTTVTPGTSTTPATTTTVTIPPGSTPGTSTTKTPGSTMQTILNIVQGNGGMSWNTASGWTPGIGFLNADGASAVLSFLNAAYDAQITSTPRIVTLDNQMATIEVTRGYPVINITGGTQNSSGSSSVTYSNVGTILQVTPRISANDFIWLRVIPVVSSHFGDQIITIEGGSGNPSTSYTVPIFDVRRIDSQVMIPDGDTLVMGGLINDNPTATYTKVPLLGDIPGLGWAFKSESKATTKDNLIIFLTPSIIKNSDFQPPTAISANFLQSKPPVMKHGVNPNSIWDGAEPHGDWSNPAPVPGEFDK